MIIRFNIAQLERERCEALGTFLAELQRENKAELDVSNVEFPKKFLIKVDDNEGMDWAETLNWNLSYNNDLFYLYEVN